jgi:hypothetical protein
LRKLIISRQYNGKEYGKMVVEQKDNGDERCHNLSLGLATKARGLQGCGPRERLGVISHVPKSAKTVRE